MRLHRDCTPLAVVVTLAVVATAGLILAYMLV